MLRNELDQKLDTLQNQNSECLSQLESMTGKTFDQIKAVADSTQYFDMSAGAVAQLTFADAGLPWAPSQESLMTYAFGQGGPDWIAETATGTQYVFLSQYFWTSYAYINMGGTLVLGSKPTTLADRQQTLFHELWHELNISDNDMGGSLAFDKWLQNGCTGPRPGQ